MIQHADIGNVGVFCRRIDILHISPDCRRTHIVLHQNLALKYFRNPLFQIHSFKLRYCRNVIYDIVCYSTRNGNADFIDHKSVHQLRQALRQIFQPGVRCIPPVLAAAQSRFSQICNFSVEHILGDVYAREKSPIEICTIGFGPPTSGETTDACTDDRSRLLQLPDSLVHCLQTQTRFLCDFGLRDIRIITDNAQHNVMVNFLACLRFPNIILHRKPSTMVFACIHVL